MGNLLSSTPTESIASTSNNNKDCDYSESETMEDVSCLRDSDEPVSEEQFYDTVSDEEARAKIKEKEMNEFRKQLSIKREQRKEILARHRAEKTELENALHNEKKSKIELCEANRLLRELLVTNKINIPQELRCINESSYIADSFSHMKTEIEKLKSTNITLRCDLAKTNSALQAAYSDMADLSAQNRESMKQVNALKEVISVSKTMISLREEQLNELKSKLSEIEQSLADRETNLLSTDLRQEYERQLQNIRTLRGLYEERARLADVSRQALTRELDEHKVMLNAEINKTKELSSKVEDLESKVNVLEETIEDKNNIISSCQEETRGIKAEMLAINKLFSQVLLGYKNKQDLDTLVHRLEENHGILTHMAGRENGSEVSSELPKLLLEIVSQIDDTNVGSDELISIPSDSENKSNIQTAVNTTAEEIVENLPKVWRVLMELLSHQSETDVPISEKVTTCYKSVETKSGPVLVPSVSQTYIRLKDLILEKLTLIKEVNRMKQLNTHLESRLEEQEKRLCLVTNELSKTWHVVGRLRRHHHQLHTHEKILKYELQQKRKLLNELKEELEYCREKWEQAREKNDQSEKDWIKLRAEFSSRKLKPDLTSINNSAESGYSDERASDESSDSNDESEYVEPKIKCKKKLKKTFDTNIDSSADFNLAAEREDPVSDMLDVADLPLDTQDDNQECDVSDSCHSESLVKNEKLCDETEDEAADMTNESCLEESSVAENSADCIVANNEGTSIKTNDISSPSTSLQATIDPAAILKSVNDQNERLSEKDKRLEKLEKNGSDLLKKTQMIVKFSDEINNKLDNLLHQPTSSTQSEDQLNKKSEDTLNSNISTEKSNKENDLSDVTNVDNIHLKCTTMSSSCTPSQINLDCNPPSQDCDINYNTSSSSHKLTEDSTKTTEIDFSAILENVRKQNERLQLKDNRLQNLEHGCSEVVKSISNTLSSGSSLSAKLDALHVEYNKEADQPNSSKHNSESGNLESDDKNKISSETPSSSRDIDHEARFAARDLRLKRLEEQTKSLVNKVNKTATKGVKIHYKLEELHNIYGSENSRSSTPSEDTEDISINVDEIPED